MGFEDSLQGAYEEQDFYVLSDLTRQILAYAETLETELLQAMNRWKNIIGELGSDS